MNNLIFSAIYPRLTFRRLLGKTTKYSEYCNHNAMAFKKKSKHTKVYVAIILIVILVIATAAVVYALPQFFL